MPNVRSTFHGCESISYLGRKIWDILPLELKELTSAVAFKKGIEEWKPKNCQCRLCKNYGFNLRFITVTSLAFLTFFLLFSLFICENIFYIVWLTLISMHFPSIKPTLTR